MASQALTMKKNQQRYGLLVLHFVRDWRLVFDFFGVLCERACRAATFHGFLGAKDQE